MEDLDLPPSDYEPGPVTGGGDDTWPPYDMPESTATAHGQTYDSPGGATPSYTVVSFGTTMYLGDIGIAAGNRYHSPPIIDDEGKEVHYCEGCYPEKKGYSFGFDPENPDRLIIIPYDKNWEKGDPNNIKHDLESLIKYGSSGKRVGLRRVMCGSFFDRRGES